MVVHMTESFPHRLRVVSMVFAVAGIMSVFGLLNVIAESSTVSNAGGQRFVSVPVDMGPLGQVLPVDMFYGIIGAGFLVPFAYFAGAGIVYRRSRWARITGGVLSVFMMLQFPVGTVTGAVSLYFLMSATSGDED